MYTHTHCLKAQFTVLPLWTDYWQRQKLELLYLYKKMAVDEVEAKSIISRNRKEHQSILGWGETSEVIWTNSKCPPN